MRRNSDLMELFKLSILVLLLIAVLWLLPTYSKQTHTPQYDFRNWVLLHAETSADPIEFKPHSLAKLLVQAIKQGKHTRVDGFYFSGPYLNTTSSPLKIELTLKPDQSYVVKVYLPNGQTQVVDSGPTSLSVRAIGYIYGKNLPILDKQVVYNALIESYTRHAGLMTDYPQWYYDKTYARTKALTGYITIPPHDSEGIIWIWTPMVIKNSGLVDVYKDGVYIGRYRWFSQVPEVLAGKPKRLPPNFPIDYFIITYPCGAPSELKPYNRLHLKDKQSER